MPVTAACNPEAVSAVVRVSVGEKLRYTVRAPTAVRFVLADDQGNTLLSEASATREREWPVAGDYAPAPGGLVTHALGMVFGAAGELEWDVDLLLSSGALKHEVRHCSYKNAAGAVNFTAAIRIYVI